jgi:hypothetical protein
MKTNNNNVCNILELLPDLPTASSSPNPAWPTDDKSYNKRKNLRSKNKVQTYLHKPETMQDICNFSNKVHGTRLSFLFGTDKFGN